MFTPVYYNLTRKYCFCLSRTILHLPHSSSLSNWLSNVDAEPGFLSNVFERLKSLNKIDKNCNLVIDGMAIRKQIIYCHAEKRFIGHCEFGQYLNVEASDVPATEALVFMLVGLKNAWKWPIAYFMQNKSNASLQCTLIKSALELSQQAGLKVHGITFDGTSTNFATLNSLGCNLHSNVSNINTQFTLNSKTVHAIPDPCHMMKLARNCLATLTKIKSPNGMIDWSYITKLHTLQENMGLKFANKLSRIHIEWTLNKMKVKLAAQTLSKSVADALEFLCKENVCGFEGSEETIRFIREIDRLFDFLNSTNPHNKGFKAPITNQNIDCLEKDILNILDYLFSLTTIEGVPLYTSSRKTFLIGFAAAVKSIFSISRTLLNDEHFKFVLSYKFSQDYLETFFSKIRGRHGYNNNPNVMQFKWALKQILLHNEISASALGNSLYTDNDPSGSIFEIEWRKKKQEVGYDDKEEEFIEEEENLDLVENINFHNDNNTNVLKDNILYYIGGFIVRKIIRKIDCVNCKVGLVQSRSEHCYSSIGEHSHLVNLKNLGGLVSVSHDVYRVVSVAERTLLSSNYQLTGKNSYVKLTVAVKNYLAQENIFLGCCEVRDFRCHKLEIIKLITNFYFKIRLHCLARSRTVEVNPTSQRHWRNKMTLFLNQ